MLLSRSVRLGKRVALGLGAAAIILPATVIFVPRLRDCLREEWHLRRVRSSDLMTRADAAMNLLEMGSERGWVQVLRGPRPFLQWLMKIEVPLRFGELDPGALERAIEQALARGEITDSDLVTFSELSFPVWRRAMDELDSRRPEDGSTDPRLTSSRTAPHPRTSSPGRSH